MAFVYRHIRLDTNQVFYVGVGTQLRRAYDKRVGRNRFWKFITNKTDYDVEILFDNVSYEFALEKEMEFIKLYGRRDLGLGTLCNLNDGGGGNKGYKITDSVKKLFSEMYSGENNPFYGKTHTKETKERIKHTFYKSGQIPHNATTVIIDEVSYNSIEEASRLTGYTIGGIKKYIKFGKGLRKLGDPVKKHNQREILIDGILYSSINQAVIKLNIPRKRLIKKYLDEIIKAN